MTTLGNWELDAVQNVDALTLLKGLPDNSVNTCVTSPPYFGLRSYTDGDTREVGKEETPEQYVAALVEVFREVKRVLRDDGTLWLNLGDSYVGATSEYAEGGSAGKNARVSKKTVSGLPNEARGSRNRALYAAGLPMKSLLLMPARVALALQADGWYLRSEIIWHKPNCMPESVTDRPTKAHETVFLLTKTATYWYDAEAIKEPAQDWGTRDRTNGKYTSGDVPISGGKHHGLKGVPKQDALGKRTYTGFNERYFSEPHPLTRNKRSVWTIPTQPYSGAHFAVMPEALVEPCVLAGCPETVCAVCGAPYERQVERVAPAPPRATGTVYAAQAYATPQSAPRGANADFGNGSLTTLGFAPTCACNGGTAHGVVLDPFGGAATVGVVAKRLNRHYLLSEINPAYVELARDRLAGVTPMLAGFAAVLP